MKKQKKFYFMRKLAEELEQEAEKQGVSESHYAQEAVKAKLKKDKKNG